MSNTKPINRPGAKIVLCATTMLLFMIIALFSGCKNKVTNEPPPGAIDTLRFVFLADSRGDSLGYPVDTTALSPIIRQIAKLSPLPEFVIFGGDMSYRGYMDGGYTFPAWKALFEPVTSQGVKLYTALGNHELYHKHASYGYLLVNQKAYQADFTENPNNGPTGYDHLAFTFTDAGSSSFFAVLDPYFVNKDTVHMGLGGHIDSVQMTWLQQQVAASSALHKFLIIHTPYYYFSDDPQEPSAADTTLTRLWSFLDVNKFDMYMCGHSHLYSRRTIVDTVPPIPQPKVPVPAWQNNVVQLLNGTCGAGPSTEAIPATIQKLWNVHNNDTTFYFSVVDVIGHNVIVNSYQGYRGAYTIFDTFTITK